MSRARVGQLVVMTCDQCLTAAVQTRRAPDEDLARTEVRLEGIAGGRGWSISKAGRDTCPKCLETAAEFSREARAHRRRVER